MSLRERAERLRSVPLEEVLLLWGATRDRADKAKWRTPCGVISVTGAKFKNWNRAVGGGGAIDLAMHLGNLDFQGAIEWLSRNFPPSDLSEPSPAPRSPLTLPQRDARKLSALRKYLVHERRLPADLIETLIAYGTLYADTRANAVFLLLAKEGAPVGAEIRGTTSTPWRGMAPGSRKDEGYFSLAAPQTDAIILCESAIDAVSCLALHPRTLCVSTAGARPDPLWLPSLLQSDKPVYCGFDADPTGDAMARAMIAAYPRVHRLRPELKDWNDVLIHPRR
ncbi:MAG: DUF3991 and TOPRIM domain-containing protein [Planctomycetes bacterium]|nr:DUF3991 and TOPRIM domain-containing protein [Planctomycetota bacterium]